MRRLLAIALAAACCGCLRYFKVTDPAGGGRVYYTTFIEETQSGSIRFQDLQTGARVTMPASEVKEIRQADLPPELRAK